MNTISNTGSTNSSAYTPTQNSSATNGADKNTSNESNQVSQNSSSQVSISDKAKKLAELKQEFFASGPMRNSDIPKLAAKLVEIGLMDSSRLAEFNASTIDSRKTASQELGEFALDRAAKIADDDSKKDLFDMLEFIGKTFKDVEAASQHKDFASKLEQASKAMDEFLNKAEFKALDKDTQTSYINIKLGLNLIQQLPEARTSQGKLDSYLKVAQSR